MIVSNLNNNRTRKIFSGIVFLSATISIYAWHLVVNGWQQKWLITWLAPKETNHSKQSKTDIRREEFYGFDTNQNMKNISRSRKLGLQDTEWQEAFPKKILIISRGRSGSSFLGNLFNLNKQVFYLFEPLGWASRDRGNHQAKYEVFNDIYDCRFTDKTYLNFLLHERSFRKKSKKLSTFPGQCTKISRSSKRCLSLILKSSCSGARSIVAKVLTHRLPNGGLWGIRKTLDANKGLRIVHLVRDPRRVIASMKKAGWLQGKNFTEQVQYVCGIVWANIRHVQNESIYYKNRYKLVVFNDMMVDPFSTVKELYDFLELGPVPESIFSWIKKSTMGNVKGKSGTYQTTRNSTEVLVRKVDFPKSEEMAIGKYCADVINFMSKIKSNILD